MRERRTQRRVKLKATARINIRNHAIKCVSCENISEGGMCVTVREAPPVHSDCSIVVDVKIRHKKISFESPSHVLWSRPVSPGGKDIYLGMRFTQTDEENRERIRIILDSLMS